MGILFLVLFLGCMCYRLIPGKQPMWLNSCISRVHTCDRAPSAPSKQWRWSIIPITFEPTFCPEESWAIFTVSSFLWISDWQGSGNGWMCLVVFTQWLNYGGELLLMGARLNGGLWVGMTITMVITLITTADISFNTHPNIWPPLTWPFYPLIIVLRRLCKDNQVL